MILNAHCKERYNPKNEIFRLLIFEYMDALIMNFFITLVFPYKINIFSKSVMNLAGRKNVQGEPRVGHPCLKHCF